MSTLVLHQLSPSPNTQKVQLALHWKKIPFEAREIDPMDRARLVELSGQPLAPVLEHEGRVLFDSGAILRYLDANWRTEPRLFRTDRTAMRELENWELSSRTEFAEPLGIMFDQAFAKSPDAAAIARANKLLAERTKRVEDVLSGREFLLADGELSAADLTLAPRIGLAMIDPARAAGHPIVEFFVKNHVLDGAFPNTRAWVARTMAPLAAKR